MVTVLESWFARASVSAVRQASWALALFVIGVLFGPLGTAISPLAYAVLFGGILCWVLGAWGIWRFVAVCLLCFWAGIFRYVLSETPAFAPTPRSYTHASVSWSGTVVTDPALTDTGQTVALARIFQGERSMVGKVQVTLSRSVSVQYGDELSFQCQMQVPRSFGEFDYARFLQAKGILAICRAPIEMSVKPMEGFSPIRLIYQFKHRLGDQLGKMVPQPHASFLFGLIFGGDVGLSKEWQEAFSQTGLSHILAASGFNVSLFTFVFYGWFVQYAGKRRAAIVTAGLLGVYVVIAGAGAAVIRAAVFGVMMLLATLIGRRAHVVNGLLLTAVLMLLWNPRWLLDDVGFQLSFVAFAAIVFIAPHLERRLSFLPEAFGVRDALAGSLAAIFLTLPIMLWQFGSVSLVAPFANVFVLPLLPWLMFYAMALLPLSFFSLTLAKWLAFPALWGSQYVLWMVRVFSSLEFASISVPFARILAGLSAVIIILFSIAFFSRE